MNDDSLRVSRQVAHAEPLPRDARACQLPTLVARRRVALRGLRKRLRSPGG
jgi:hypothetical protein